MCLTTNKKEKRKKATPATLVKYRRYRLDSSRGRVARIHTEIMKMAAAKGYLLYNLRSELLISIFILSALEVLLYIRCHINGRS